MKFKLVKDLYAKEKNDLLYTLLDPAVESLNRFTIDSLNSVSVRDKVAFVTVCVSIIIGAIMYITIGNTESPVQHMLIFLGSQVVIVLFTPFSVKLYLSKTNKPYSYNGLGLHVKKTLTGFYSIIEYTPREGDRSYVIIGESKKELDAMVLCDKFKQKVINDSIDEYKRIVQNA